MIACSSLQVISTSQACKDVLQLLQVRELGAGHVGAGAWRSAGVMDSSDLRARSCVNVVLLHMQAH